MNLKSIPKDPSKGIQIMSNKLTRTPEIAERLHQIDKITNLEENITSKFI